MILPVDYPKIDLPFEEQSPMVLLAMCIWGEARGEDMAAQLMVGCTVRNRVNKPGWWGHDWRSVILQPYQFSSFNETDPNRKRLLYPLQFGTPAEWYPCFYAAMGVMEGYVGDLSQKATHYYDTSIIEPKWAIGKLPVAIRGKLRFYQLQ